MRSIFYQDDGDRNYYVMDFSQNNLLDPVDSITGTPTVSSEIRGGFTSDLTIEDVAVSGFYVGMWISGGTELQTYKIEVTAETSQGRTLEGDGFLKIGD